jgi:hypothetical protein
MLICTNPVRRKVAANCLTHAKASSKFAGIRGRKIATGQGSGKSGAWQLSRLPNDAGKVRLHFFRRGSTLDRYG